jgi:hypothetical protein
MNTHKQRLLNVAKALREAKKPENFTMERYGGFCRTPFCAIGHYASRADLQRAFRLSLFQGSLQTRLGKDIAHDHHIVCGHFGITSYEAESIFGQDGCGGAQYIDEAVKFIEDFAERKWPEQAAA